MDFEKQDKFFKRFPDLFIERNLPATQTGMCWGIDTGDGWFDLLWGLCERLETFKGLRFTQVKEKFGGLRVYYRYDSKSQLFVRGLNSRSKRRLRRQHKKIDYLIEQAENISFKICEFCGKNADGKSKGYWDPTVVRNVEIKEMLLSVARKFTTFRNRKHDQNYKITP